MNTTAARNGNTQLQQARNLAKRRGINFAALNADQRIALVEEADRLYRFEEVARLTDEVRTLRLVAGGLGSFQDRARAAARLGNARAELAGAWQLVSGDDLLRFRSWYEAGALR